MPEYKTAEVHKGYPQASCTSAPSSTSAIGVEGRGRVLEYKTAEVHKGYPRALRHPSLLRL